MLRPIRRPDPARTDIPAAGRRGSAEWQPPARSAHPAHGLRATRPGPEAGSEAEPRPGRRADHPRRPGVAWRGARCARPRRGARVARTRPAPGPSPSGSGSRPEPARDTAPRGRRPLFSRLRRDRRRLLQLLAVALGVTALGPVVAFAVRLPVLRRPEPRRRRHQPGRDDLVHRRQPARPDSPGRATGWSGRPDPPVRAGRRTRGGGPVVLLQPRVRPDRHRTSGVQPAARRHRRWLDDHAAVRQEHTRRRRGTLWRKYQEVVVAVKISQQRRKDEILGDYLNAIYFGRGAYGIQSAAQAYFGADVEDLTPSQGALLAGVIQSPSHWDPAASPERAFERWSFVLDGMVSQGWLTPQQRTAAQFPSTLPRQPTSDASPADSPRAHPRRRQGRARAARDQRAGDHPGGAADHHHDRSGEAGAGRHAPHTGSSRASR